MMGRRRPQAPVAYRQSLRKMQVGRIRTIKPEFPQSESVGHLSREARLLFLLLFTVADDEGRCRGSSRILASLLYPYDDDARGLIDGWIAELEQFSMARRYCHEDQTYLEVINFKKHQKIDHPSASKLPSFDESSLVLASPREEERGIKEGISTSTKDQGEDRREPKAKPPAFVLPDWVPKEQWEAWMPVRKRKRAENTPYALNIALRKLAELKLEGYDPAEVLEQSILKGYTGLFEVRGKTNGKHDPLAGMIFANGRNGNGKFDKFEQMRRDDEELAAKFDREQEENPKGLN